MTCGGLGGGTGAWLVRVVEAVALPSVAVIVAVPADGAFAIPCDPLALEMVATSGEPEVQVTSVVRSFSPNRFKQVPVAVNCSVAPAVIDGFTGLTAMDVSVAFTVSVGVPPARAKLPDPRPKRP